MKQSVQIIILFFLTTVCYAQVADDFSDGDYVINPTWTPDNVSNWTVVNGQLRSNSTIASSTYFISTPSTQAQNAQWEFYINLQFNTSSVNYVDVYITSSNAAMVSADGYFIRIGGTLDEISLYKSAVGVNSILINGTDGVTNVSNSILKIKVTRDAANVWTLQRDTSGTGNNYFTEGTVIDNSFVSSSFFGIRITQSTPSFFSKHFFDDFYVGAIILDTSPPQLNSISVISSTEIDLLFDEQLESASAQNVNNYLVDNGIGNPANAIIQPDQKIIRLTFVRSFGNGIQNQLTLTGIKDLAGNTISSTSKNFFFFQAVPTKQKDIIITEIFADPSPQIGLPDAEFIELYNRSMNPIDLAGWKLSDGSSIAIFSSQIILPKEYWIITSSASVSKFSVFSKTIGLANFPTLNNDGDALTLKTTATIDSVNYNTTWYQNDDKKNGGWSLEIIDIENSCGEGNNWIASTDTKGGTPAKQNLAFANKPDLLGPKLLNVIAQPTQLILAFDEKLEKPLGNLSFSISPAIPISNYTFNNAALTEIKIELNQPLVLRQLYSIQISKLRDCAGNFTQENFNQLSFALPEAADSLDILVNEILFNPRPSGVDFVEVYNQSAKYINLKNHKIASYENGEIKNPKPISSDLIFAPHSLIAFTSDTAALRLQYLNGAAKNFYQMDLPGFNDDAGSIILVSDKDKKGDTFLYSDQYHSHFLKDKEGVSLERISILENTNEPSNWKSANSSVGFATPGLVNSNSRPETTVNENAIRIEPEIFSPSRPGQDFAKVNYRFDQSGMVANIKILDQQGRLIKTLANNLTLGFEGFFRWDGDREDGSKVRLGYYLAWVEVFDDSGKVMIFRQRVVVAGD
jgi:Lamin Tail Domain